MNFMEWVPGWEGGAAPSHGTGVDAPANIQRVLVLRQCAELEELCGEKKWRSVGAVVRALPKTPSCALSGTRNAGLFADNIEHSNYSEHAQCLAYLTYVRNGFAGHEDKVLRAAEGLLEARRFVAHHYLLHALPVRNLQALGPYGLVLPAHGIMVRLESEWFEDHS
jgi:hypothetical protein